MTDLGKLTGDYNLDTVQTRIGFVARHTMATRVRGRFEEFEGAVYLDGDQPSKSEVRLTIRTRSIQTRNSQRDDLLRAKFLGVTDHPTVTFTSTRVEQTDGTKFEVTGDLGMRGLVRPVTVDVEVTGTEEGARVDFKGSVTIDRNDWGVNWNAATRIMIRPSATIEVEAAAIRRP
ncbi:YceI family protein [Actinomadura nitritigenes]|uniref:YceI family protein n=1 Tax=Actinomadura nitritigenes TaxID=134602 RepID=A0ABS3RC39_9ACTN|nr:YceI family protein [Actinomadura nitritigenes]MBO2443793.1 YceI family protein [Actinomadura nitritigenes]